MEDGEGEASKLPKVSTALISTIYSRFPAACEGNTSVYINAQRYLAHPNVVRLMGPAQQLPH